MPSEEIIAWIDSVLTPEVRDNIASQVHAHAANAGPLIKQLQQLRTQLREKSYAKIYEARANVADVLANLMSALSQLIHYSNVAGEGTSAYISLMRNVSTVTQKLSFFGEDDADGDGVRDEFEGEEGEPGPDMDLEIDDTNQPSNKTVAPEDEVHEKGPTEDENVDPDRVVPQDADGDHEQAPPSEEMQTEGEPAEEDSETPAPKEDGSDAAPEQDDGEAPKEGDDFEGEFDNVVKNLPKDEKSAAPKEGTEPQDEAEQPKEDSGDDAEQPEEGEKDESGDEEKKEDKGDKPKKKGFLQKLDDEGKAHSSVHAKVEAPSTDKNGKPAAHEFRFAYLGLTPDNQKVRALVTDRIFIYQPQPDLFGGDAVKLDAAINKLLQAKPGYTAVLTKLNSLVQTQKLKIVGRRAVGETALRKDLKSDVNKGKIGTIKPEAGTPWRYRGVGLQKIKNSEAALWFEVGNTEYAAVPGNNDDLDTFDAKIQKRLKGLAYDAGLAFITGLLKKGYLKPIYSGKVEE